MINIARLTRTPVVQAANTKVVGVFKDLLDALAEKVRGE